MFPEVDFYIFKFNKSNTVSKLKQKKNAFYKGTSMNMLEKNHV